MAIEKNNEEIIKILLCHPSVDLKIRDKSGNTCFSAALNHRNHAAAQAILNKMPNAAEQTDQRGKNFLHSTIINEDLEGMLFLLSCHVDVNARVHDLNQSPPLLLAAATKNEMICTFNFLIIILFET